MTLITSENILILALWLIFTLVMLVFVVPAMTSRLMCTRFGLVKVFQGGKPLYAVQDPDGNPVKVPIGMKVGKDDKPEVVMGYAGLAWSLPTIAYQQTVSALMHKMHGKAGKLTQMANNAAIEGMDLNQASQAMALQAFAKGQYGKAIMAMLAPKIKETLTKQMAGGPPTADTVNPKTAGRGGQGYNPG